MRKWPKTESEDLGLYSSTAWRIHAFQVKNGAHMQKAQLLTGFPKIKTSDGDFIEAGAIFLSGYSDREMPAHETRLASELTHCPDPAGGNLIDALYAAEV